MLFGLHTPATQCRHPLLATGETAGHEFSGTQRQTWCEAAGQNIRLSLERASFIEQHRETRQHWTDSNVFTATTLS